jgi:hypothetical protein
MESQEVLVAAPVFVGQKDVLAIVAAGDGMRYADRHHPRWAGHQVWLVPILSCPQMFMGSVPSAPLGHQLRAG